MGFELMNFIYKSKSPSSLKEHGLTICVTVCHFIISRPFVIWTGHFSLQFPGSRGFVMGPGIGGISVIDSFG